MGKIFLSCGHEDQNHPNGWSVREKTVNTWNGKGSVLHSQYCSDCFCYFLTKWPETLIANDLEEREWLGGNE